MTEKAEQQELDALLRSVITTIGSIGQRIGENEANLASSRVALTQAQDKLVVLEADFVVAREKEAVAVAGLESSLNQLHNKQEQLATKMDRWKFGEGTSLMDAMWTRSRTERVYQLTTASLDTLREREAINLDDTVLKESDWRKVFEKLGRCRGDGKTLQLRRLSLHNCALPEVVADQLGTVLVYSMPDLEFLSLRGNHELGHDGWTSLLTKISGGGGLAKLVTLNLQECRIPVSCRRALHSLFSACPALLSVEVSGDEDQWIEDLWQSIGTEGSGYDYEGYASSGNRAAVEVASRVAAASALASTAAQAFASGKKTVEGGTGEEQQVEPRRPASVVDSTDGFEAIMAKRRET